MLRRSILIALVLLSGCYYMQVDYECHRDGTVSVTPYIVGDETLAGDELYEGTVMAILLFPEISQNYSPQSYYIGEMFDRKIVYMFKPKRRVKLENFSVSKDGSYRFSMRLRLDRIKLGDRADDVVLVVRAIMPGRIEESNSLQVERDTATWSLTRRQLKAGVNLHAVAR